MKKLLLIFILQLGLIQSLFANSYLFNENNISSEGFTNSVYVNKFQSLSQVLVSSKESNIILNPVFEQDALEYIISYKHNNTEFLSRKIEIATIYNVDTTQMIQRLLSSQNFDGGFGEDVGYVSTNIDTAFALKALNVAGIDNTQLSKAVTYLKNQQKTDGSWSENANESDIYLSAIVMHSLWLTREQYNITSNLQMAKTYLESKRNIDGLWGENFQSAVSLIALAPMLNDNSSLLPSINSLNQSQLLNQSWNNDPYTTALVLQAISAALKPTPNPDLGNISGNILDSDTATALNGVKITLVGNNTTTTALTNIDGSFNFDGLKDGIYLLDISDDNYAPMNVSIRMIGDDIDLGNILLNKNQNSTISTIKGVIKNQTTGLPIEGALVSVGSQEVLSDSAGNYLISSIEVGEYILSVQKSSYLNTNAHISVPPNTLLHYNALLKENDFNIISSIKGTIVDKVSQTGLVGVSIILTGENSRSFTTLSDGNFIFENITLGDYKLEIKKDGYNTAISNISINQSEIIDIGIILLKLSDALTDTITLSGTVSQIINNTPIQNALISVGGLSVYSDEFGNYEITNIPLGNLFVEISNAQYLPYSQEFQINEITTLILSPKLQKRDSDIAIFGTIFDVNSSQPLSDVTIEYMGENNGTVITDANGYYFISPVTARSLSDKTS